MQQTLKHTVRGTVDGLLGAVGLIRTKLTAFSDYRDYIPFEETIAGAKAANMAVGDYIDAKHNQPGITRATVDKIAELGVFAGSIERVCEIGPGSGRYLAQTLQRCKPSHYEIYETAPKWRDWLATQYQVVSRATDGSSLAETPSQSIDLAHAHKVFPGQPSLVMARYFEEMARVTRAGGFVVFDIVTEACLDDAALGRWHTTGRGYQHYPCLMPKQFTVDFFGRRGLRFVGSFLAPMEPGSTEIMVFRREQA